MRGPAAAVFLVAFLAMSALSAAAQGHEHGVGSGVVVSHEANAAGDALVGNIAHFGVLYLGDDEVPDFHEQNHVRVSQNGVAIFETTLDSGHDYDGVSTFDVVFPVPGQYVVEALGEQGEVLSNFTGRVTAPASLLETEVVLTGPDTAAVGMQAEFTVETRAAGTLVPHSDTLFEVRRGDAVVFRTHLHSHEEAQALRYVFVEPGQYTVQATSYLSYPEPGGVAFAPKTVQKQVMALPGASSSSTIVMAPPPPQTGLNAVAMGDAVGDLVLMGTYDPYTVVGPGTLQHLNVMLMDKTVRQTVQHVDFTAWLYGPGNQERFASGSLHEYDGILEIATVQQAPGEYFLIVDAEADGFTGHLEMPFVVAPPVLAVPTVVFSVGPQLLDAAGLDGLQAGVPGALRFLAHDAAGNPFAHSEIDVQVADATGVPVLQAKLHTHDDGAFAWNLTLPTAGEYTMRLSPFPLMPQPVGPFYGAALGDPLTFKLLVAQGPGIPIPPPDAPTEVPAMQAVPSLGPAVGLLLLGLGTFLARRRGPSGT